MLAMMWGNTAFPPRALAKRSSEVSPAIALLEERARQTNSTIIRFFLSSKISSKKYSCKIIFGQTRLNENNFTSCVWWALIEEIAPRAELRDGW